MSQVTTTLQATFRENNDSLLKSLEGMPEDFKTTVISMVKLPDTEQQVSKYISRNKRAVIETVIAQWVNEAKPESYGDQENREHA